MSPSKWCALPVSLEIPFTGLNFSLTWIKSTLISSRLHRGGEGRRVQAGRDAVAELQHDGEVVVDAGGGHGRRHQVLHGVVAAQEGRVLLQDMVLRQEDFQITGDSTWVQSGMVRQIHKLDPTFQLTDKRIIMPRPGVRRGRQLCDDLIKVCV